MTAALSFSSTSCYVSAGTSTLQNASKPLSRSGCGPFSSKTVLDTNIKSPFGSTKKVWPIVTFPAAPPAPPPEFPGRGIRAFGGVNPGARLHCGHKYCHNGGVAFPHDHGRPDGCAIAHHGPRSWSPRSWSFAGKNDLGSGVHGLWGGDGLVCLFGHTAPSTAATGPWPSRLISAGTVRPGKGEDNRLSASPVSGISGTRARVPRKTRPRRGPRGSASLSLGSFDGVSSRSASPCGQDT